MMQFINEAISKKLVLTKKMKKKIFINVSVVIPYTAATLLELFFKLLLIKMIHKMYCSYYPMWTT
jgi:hypothetical protein